MAKVIPVSFKENDEDMKLYVQLMKKSDKSCFIKDAVRFYMEYHENKNKPTKMQTYP